MFALASLSIALVVVAALLGWALEQDTRRFARRARRLAVRAFDAEIRLGEQRRLGSLQRRTEDAVELTTVAVRTVHKGIASIPFSVLKRSQVDPEALARAQRIHDATANGVYDSISAVNRLVGEQIRRGLSGKPEPAKDDPT